MKTLKKVNIVIVSANSVIGCHISYCLLRNYMSLTCYWKMAYCLAFKARAAFLRGHFRKKNRRTFGLVRSSD